MNVSHIKAALEASEEPSSELIASLEYLKNIVYQYMMGNHTEV